VVASEVGGAVVAGFGRRGAVVGGAVVGASVVAGSVVAGSVVGGLGRVRRVLGVGRSQAGRPGEQQADRRHRHHDHPERAARRGQLPAPAAGRAQVPRLEAAR
jgi:hypothetical protein